MPKNITRKKTKQERSTRYQSIIDRISRLDSFDMSLAKTQCDDRPFFVTRVVNELVNDGWLVKEAVAKKGKEKFRWNGGRGKFSSSNWIENRVNGVRIAATPEKERPRERLLDRGAEALTDSELLAILIRSGRPGESAVMGGDMISKAYQNRLAELPSATQSELKEVSKTVSKAAYCQIMAGIELGRRVAALAKDTKRTRISGSQDAIEFCQRRFDRLIEDSRQEEFHVVTLDTKNQIIDTHQVTVGTLDASLVHPREVFRVAIKDAASSVILVHNHPSGDPTPSREDFQVTERLTESGNLLGIDVLDHIVLGRPKAVSIREC
jgi:DNA repair protein RadC